jgi:catechol 2,3-dioxygenase
MSYGIPPPAYRLPSETRLGAVRLQVSDLERSLDYYQQVLGLQVIARDRAHASLGSHGDSHALVHLHTRPGTRSTPRGGRLGLYHFALLLPDRPSLGRFARHLGEVGAHAASADHAVSEALYLWDPDGLGIEVYADRPRELWRVQGREIFMTTERLDLPGLVMAGGEERWGGLPQGTSLGHMHLHVGDLETAEGFYHVALGFDKTVWSFPGALFLSAGGYHHHLGTNTWAAGADRAQEDEARLLEWEIIVPSGADRDAAARSCDAAGYGVTAEGESRVVSDSWSTTLRLITT